MSGTDGPQGPDAHDHSRDCMVEVVRGQPIQTLHTGSRPERHEIEELDTHLASQMLAVDLT